MAKSTHAAGPSMTEHEALDPPVVFRRPELGLIDLPVETEESKSVGIASSPSLESESKSSAHSEPSPHKLAHTMENHSNQPETEPGSSVDSTDGGGQREPQRQSTRPRKAAANQRTARIRSTDADEFDI